MTRVVAALLLALVVLTGCGSTTTQHDSSQPDPAVSSTAGGAAAPLEIETVRTAAPRGVRVPSLGVESALDALELLPDGSLEAPPQWQVAGWYAAGTTPGERGPAVIAGHVDSPDGPAVFADLDRLSAGDLIEIEHTDGTSSTFAVDRTQVVSRDDFPTEAVYGPVPDVQLRLITCDGTYSAERGYSDNLVVFATEVGG